jgi:hypothetical protein
MVELWAATRGSYLPKIQDYLNQLIPKKVLMKTILLMVFIELDLTTAKMVARLDGK